MNKTIDVAIVGVTGTVGEALVSLLEERKFPVGKFFPLASERSAGGKVQLNGKYSTVQDVAGFDFSQAQLAFFCAPAPVAAEFVPRATAAHCVVIDNSTQFRADDDVPLVIPEVNPEAINQYQARNIIASPDSMAIQICLALKPIYDAVGIERINVVTFQAVSGDGKAGVGELATQTAALLNMRVAKPEIYAKQIAFNVLPQIGDIENDGYAKGYTSEEIKLLQESQKILGDDAILINATVTQVPVFFGHSASLHVETREKLTAVDARKLLKKAPGLTVMDKGRKDGYPTAVSEAAGDNAVFVGRIRDDISHPTGINLWVVADNVRKGAALNSVQIAEFLVKVIM